MNPRTVITTLTVIALTTTAMSGTAVAFADSDVGSDDPIIGPDPYEHDWGTDDPGVGVDTYENDWGTESPDYTPSMVPGDSAENTDEPSEPSEYCQNLAADHNEAAFISMSSMAQFGKNCQ